MKLGEVEVMVKGALEQIINVCIGFLEGGIHHRKMTMDYRIKIFQLASNLGNTGLRSLFYNFKSI